MNKCYKTCSICMGYGKIKLPILKRARRRYVKRLKQFEDGVIGVEKPKELIPHIDICHDCKGTGLISSNSFPEIDYSYPSIAIIGAGIGGVALALACLHRGIPYTLYEKDISFDARRQGYGLTLQQASKAIEGLGIIDLNKGLTSTRHVVHNPSGKIIGEWGVRRYVNIEEEKLSKRRNIHISRQSLRSKLLAGLQSNDSVKWGYNLKSLHKKTGGGFELDFQVGDIIKSAEADLIVGADGIRSSVRNTLISNEDSPLHYLGCIVILGICPLEVLGNIQSNLLDSATVFQTVNGNDRIYIMPFNEESIMWQLSFPMNEGDAKSISKKGPEVLKKEGINRLLDWHTPIPEILQATETSLISGYPVYDREPLIPEQLKTAGNISLIGDAMHPMSPFKGQGANQAILDALDLARDISTKCGIDSSWREKGLRETVLEDFEIKMLDRSTPKVKDSAKAVQVLHSKVVLHEGDTPRGRGI